MIIVRLHVLASILLGAHFHRTHSFAPPSLPTRRIIALPQTQHQQFQGPLEDHSTIDTRGTTMTALFSSTNKGNKNVGADFDYQELKINLRAMKKQQLTTANQLEEGKRKELEGYVRNVVKQRPSPIPLWEIGGNDAKGGMLSGTKWRLSFSTQAVTNESLPPGVQIQLDFVDERRVDYSMEFTKTFGLSKLTAESSYQVDVSLFKVCISSFVRSFELLLLLLLRKSHYCFFFFSLSLLFYHHHHHYFSRLR
jgi:hypothetical protein